MADFRKIIISIVIGILFTAFVFAFNFAVNSDPKMEDYCKNTYMDSPKAVPIEMTPPVYKNFTCPEYGAPTKEQKQQCVDNKGQVEYFDKEGNIVYGDVSKIENCPTSWKCNTCYHEFDLASEKARFYQFIIAAIFSLIAIVVGLYVPYKKDSVLETIAVGFLLGGLFTLFLGTIIYYSSFQKWVKPFVILLELGVVILVAYRKLSNSKEEPKKAEKKSKK